MVKFQKTPLIIAILVSLTACNRGLFLEEESNIKNGFLLASNGLFLYNDKEHHNALVANREWSDEWEKFTFVFIDTTSFLLQSADNKYVRIGPNKNELLVADQYISEEASKLSLIINEGRTIYLQAENGKFLVVDDSLKVRASATNLEDAEHFQLKNLRPKTWSYFTIAQIVPLLIGGILILISLYCFYFREHKVWGIFFLLLGGLTLRIFTAILNSHLHLWDEQFHAIVAKNMIENPFNPMLYKSPVFPYDKFSWVGGHIWLHKQPLFLWQMAISMKIFGVNTLALRLPSIIMSTLVILIIYRIGTITLTKQAGYFAAFIFATSSFVLQISSGAIHTDHNDVAFLFYISASIWAWTEYEISSEKRKKVFLVLIGIFSGSAILVKWLTGLLVFSGWGIAILLNKHRRKSFSEYLNLLISFSIAIIIFLPWQIYILIKFPEISRYEFALNTRHFFEVIEGHGGTFWHHINLSNELYGINKFFLILTVLFFIWSLKNKTFRYSFATFIFIVYLFFSVAASKMVAFTWCISFLIYLSIGNLIDRSLKYLVIKPKNDKFKLLTNSFQLTLLLTIAFFNLDIERLQEKYTIWNKDDNSHFAIRLKTTPIIKKLPKIVPDLHKYAVFNTNPDDNVQVMFFTDAIAAYSFVPNESDYLRLNSEEIKLAIFDNGDLPIYLREDPEVIKITGYW